MRFLSILKWFVLVVSSLVILVGGGGYLYLKSTVPDYNGRVAGPVKDRVEVYRDAYGVPSVVAQNRPDAFTAVGYAMAQDRMFQMEMVRRATRGRLAEILGPDLVRVDKIFLALSAVKGLDELYDEQAPEIKKYYAAFSQGVNLFIQNGPLPLEFKILGFEPEPWRPSDCMGVAVFMAWDLNLGWGIDLLAMVVADRLGSEMVEQFFPGYPASGPTIVPPGEFTARGVEEFLTAALASRKFMGAGLSDGSNSWVLSGEKTTTGKPILCNDMHLGFGQPAIWWECGIITPDYKVKGLMVPGVPLALAGHTPKLAWGLTNVMADDADFFIEKLNPDNPDEYLVGEEWQPLRKVTREIKVKGGKTLTQVFRITRNGVIINDLKVPAPLGNRVLAMRWSGQDVLGGASPTFLGIHQATDWESFNQAVSNFGCPGQNFVYADTEGNIGYRTGVHIPRRRGGYNPILPIEGWSGKYGWDGYLPFELQPNMLNPKEGFIATANNKTVGPEYPHYISAYYAGTERIGRIRELIKAKEKHSPADMKTIHMDVKSLTAVQIRPHILEALKDRQLSEREAAALKLLKDWDLRLTVDSAAAGIFELTWISLFTEIAGDEVEPKLLEAWLKNHYIANQALLNWLESGTPLFDDTRTKEKETKKVIIRRALNKALDRLAKEFGTDDMADWKWGKIHTLTFNHPFSGQSPILDRIVNLGPYPVGGGMFTVNPLQYRLKGDLAVISGASMRHVYDFSDLEKSRGSITTGQSGHFLSDHYADQVKLWLTGETHPLTLDPKRAAETAEYQLTLEPAS